PGQRFFFNALGANSGGTWYLYAPNNQNLGGSSIGSNFEVTLSLSGTYILVLWGTSSAPLPYSFQVVTTTSPSTALDFGNTLSGNIARPGDQHSYIFNGTAGQRIYYDALDLDFQQIYTRLVAPSGGVVWDFLNESTDKGPIALTETGTYTLLIDGSNATTGNYRFRILDLAAAPPLALTTTTTAQLNP